MKPHNEADLSKAGETFKSSAEDAIVPLNEYNEIQQKLDDLAKDRQVCKSEEENIENPHENRALAIQALEDMKTPVPCKKKGDILATFMEEQPLDEFEL